MALPVDIRYFLESYEACLQLTEWFEKELHERWHSADFEESKQRQLELQLKPPQPIETLATLPSPPSLEQPAEATPEEDAPDSAAAE
jgi:hypothetical protein